MTTQTLDDLLDEFETCAYQSCFSLCDELRVKIKEALAQPEKPQPDRITTLRQLTENHSVDCLCADCVELDDIEEALAQPAVAEQHKQEPVAWISWNRVSSESKLNYHKVSSQHDASLWQHFPLYTTPPYVPTERQRKPLTDEQIVAIYGNDMMNYRDGDYMRFARAIEDAHGIVGDTHE